MPLRACILVLFLLAAPRGAYAQSAAAASARLTGRVSGAVAISASEPVSPNAQARVSIASVDAATVAVSLSGSGGGEARVNLPLRLRSNVGYSLSASFHSHGEPAVLLSVAELKATGKFVHADALEAARLGNVFDEARGTHAAFLSVRDATSRLPLLAGPAVSKAGTLNSPDNAIEFVLSIEVRPRPGGEPWSAQLTISATPSPHAGR